MNTIKSPLNYTGGKYKLLPQILPLFPKNIDTFVDLFCGGLNVSINVEANKYTCNDIESHIINLYKYFKSNNKEYIYSEILNMSNKYNLQDKEKENYLKLRNDYNNNKTDLLFYLLITSSFSNQIRFNKKGDFNLPFGGRYFNPTMQENLKQFLDRIECMNVDFFNVDFRRFNFNKLTIDDFVYIDPPYLNSGATYNEQNGWHINDEEDLLSLLDNLNDKGIKFALSNNLKYNNELLDKWKNKYIVHYINADYSNCNYHKKDKSKDMEILITNY